MQVSLVLIQMDLPGMSVSNTAIFQLPPHSFFLSPGHLALHSLLENFLLLGFSSPQKQSLLKTIHTSQTRSKCYHLKIIRCDNWNGRESTGKCLGSNHTESQNSAKRGVTSPTNSRLDKHIIVIQLRPHSYPMNSISYMHIYHSMLKHGISLITYLCNTDYNPATFAKLKWGKFNSISACGSLIYRWSFLTG